MPGVHLTLEERKSIQSGLDSCKTKAEIAVGISKSASTVSKLGIPSIRRTISLITPILSRSVLKTRFENE